MIDASLRSRATPTPTGIDRPSAAEAAEPAAHPFAEMLRQQRIPAAAPPSARTVAASVDAADAVKTPSTAAGHAARGASALVDDAGDAVPVVPSRDAGQARTRAAVSRDTARSDAATPTDATGPKASGSEPAKVDGKDTRDKATAADTDVAQIVSPLPALPAPTAAQTPPVAGPAGAATAAGAAIAATDGRAAANATVAVVADIGDGSRTTATAAHGDVRAGTADIGIDTPSRAAPRLGATSTDKADAVAGRVAEETTTVASAFGALVADARASNAAPATGERASHDLPASLVATGNVAPHATSLLAAGAAPTSATVATPVDTPDFAAAFGMQVSVLAKDGVQQAQLHLNPTDMGPVSIHITLDGALAHVDFGADVAATRHAIEAGLPELASALRDAGFTLAGGGVAQHSASSGGGSRDDATPSRAAVLPAAAGQATLGALDATARRQAQRRAAGGVDLFA